jgi:hypothetical protein
MVNLCKALLPIPAKNNYLCFRFMTLKNAKTFFSWACKDKLIVNYLRIIWAYNSQQT